MIMGQSGYMYSPVICTGFLVLTCPYMDLCCGDGMLCKPQRAGWPGKRLDS